MPTGRPMNVANSRLGAPKLLSSKLLSSRPIHYTQMDYLGGLVGFQQSRKPSWMPRNVRMQVKTLAAKHTCRCQQLEPSPSTPVACDAAHDREALWLRRMHVGRAENLACWQQVVHHSGQTCRSRPAQQCRVLVPTYWRWISHGFPEMIIFVSFSLLNLTATNVHIQKFTAMVLGTPSSDTMVPHTIGG